ncbi:NCS2 family permease [Bacteriovoracaceae bacterium]|nr:NCS2 family permease [Bacteriovoracaceae bacterium]
MKQTEFKTEVMAGITSYLATLYIVIVNPSILQHAGIPFTALVTSTVLVCSVSSIAMGLFAKNPIVVAPGMGLNAFFTYTLVHQQNLSPQIALGAVFWSGLIFMLMSAFGIREKIANAIPYSIRIGVTAGIGLFIAFIGFKNAGIIIANKATIIGSGDFGNSAFIFAAGLIFTVFLHIKKVNAALLWGILFTTLLSFLSGRLYGDEILVAFGSIVQYPDFSLIGELDIMGSLKWSLLPAILSLLFTDFFDSVSTFMSVAEAADLKDKNGQPKNLRASLLVDGFSTFFSGLVGSSPGTAYIESACGVKQGGRTGVVAIVAGILFLPLMFFSPLVSSIPIIATAPVLVLVGVFMMAPLSKISWNNWEDAVPTFMVFFLIPFSFSITIGIVSGLLTWLILKILLKRWEDISIISIILGILSAIFLVLK